MNFILALAIGGAVALFVCLVLLGWWALGGDGLRQAFRPDRGDDRFHRR